MEDELRGDEVPGPELARREVPDVEVDEPEQDPDDCQPEEGAEEAPEPVEDAEELFLWGGTELAVPCPEIDPEQAASRTRAEVNPREPGLNTKRLRVAGLAS